ncbi:MAG: hypothetical protein FWD34_04200 [Oscillospiraceae bacterium]|nr:hypothetical protein [Oscillospiraceae bacterium]
MKRITILLLTAVVLLTSCVRNVDNPSDSSETTEPPETTITTTDTTTTEPQIILTHEQQLLKSIEEKSKGTVVLYDYADYGGLGEFVMFAIVSDGDWIFSDSHMYYYASHRHDVVGDLWFADGSDTQLIKRGGIMVQFREFSGDRYVFFEPFSVVGAPWYVITVRDGQLYEPAVSFTGGGFNNYEGDDLVYATRTYDWGILDGGVTYKPYWLYYDEELRDFVEYGAIEITLEQLMTFENHEQIIKEIDEYNVIALKNRNAIYEIISIFYRGNGYIHVNIQLLSDEFEYEFLLDSNRHITAKYDGKTITELTEGYYDWDRTEGTPIQGGLYLPALCPEAAVFPDITDLFD